MSKSLDTRLEQELSYFAQNKARLTAWDVLCALRFFARDFPGDVPPDLIEHTANGRTERTAQLYADLLSARASLTLDDLLAEFRSFVDDPGAPIERVKRPYTKRQKAA